MEKEFAREAFYSRFGPKAKKEDREMFAPALGRVTVGDGSVSFFGAGGDIFIPLNDVKDVFIIFENPPYMLLIFVVAINLLVISQLFQYEQKIEIATVFSFLFALTLLLDFFYLTLKKGRKWIQVIYESEGAKQEAFFTCDWRGSFFKLPWLRQDKLWMWLLRRGDSLVLYKKIKQG